MTMPVVGRPTPSAATSPATSPATSLEGPPPRAPSPSDAADRAPIARTTLSPGVARYVAASTQAASESSAPATTKHLEAEVDRCLVSARARYLVDGRAVQAAPHFRMAGGFNQASTRAGLEALAGRIGAGPGKLPMDVVGHVLAGRGTPAQIAQVTQALIDAGRLPPQVSGERDETRIQRMMWAHGVGIDCAGYVQRALVGVHGKSREQLGLREPLDEDLGSLGRNPHFQRVPLEAARPGDVLTMRDNDPGQPGHTLLVARHDEADGPSMSWRFPLGDPRSAAFVAAARLEVFEVDSSWGAGPSGDHGGVHRATWIHEPVSGLWASFDNHPHDLVVSDTPYEGHAVVGVYRPT